MIQRNPPGRAKKGRSGLGCFIFSLFLFLPVGLFGQKNSCLDCHLELEESLQAPAKNFAADVHKQYGLGCQDCHGGNPGQEDVELAKDKTFKGVPSRVKIPEFCGSCHADAGYMRRFSPNLRVDQLALYWTSRHGLLLKKGDSNVAVCTDCHGVHGIQSASFPKAQTFPWNIPQTCGRCHSSAERMKAYGLPQDQVEEYRQSVHAQALFEKKDLSAPVCNDCHGNHGAAPPEVTSIAFICRQCHPSAGDLFSKSPHRAAFDELGISECEVCHGNHQILRPSDEMLAGGAADVCTQCHDADTKPYQTGARVRADLVSFVASFAEAEALLDRAERQGVEVSDPRFRLQEATTALVTVRNLTHGLSVPDIETTRGEGLKVLAEVKGRGEAALREAKFRKTGLIIATAFIFLLAAALFLKIRFGRAPASG
jgi:predicted CXXCH cytochrome family protein